MGVCDLKHKHLLDGSCRRGGESMHRNSPTSLLLTLPNARPCLFRNSHMTATIHAYCFQNLQNFQSAEAVDRGRLNVGILAVAQLAIDPSAKAQRVPQALASEKRGIMMIATLPNTWPSLFRNSNTTATIHEYSSRNSRFSCVLIRSANR